jgi:hypothetical protein
MRHTIARIVRRFTLVLILASLTLLAHGISPGDAHQDPCHRLHSCPWDYQTYVCGDRGRCDQCLHNDYCQGSKPRSVAQPPPHSPKTAPPDFQMAKVVRVIAGDTLALSTGEGVRWSGMDTPDAKSPRKPVQPCAPWRLQVTGGAEGRAGGIGDAMAEINLYDALTTLGPVAAKGGPP